MGSVYFICWAWQRPGWDYWKYEHKFSIIHPIEWLYKMKDQPEDYRIVFWQKMDQSFRDEITEYFDSLTE